MLEKLKATMGAATEGPWEMDDYRPGDKRVHTNTDLIVYTDDTDIDEALASGRFACAARNAVPALIEMVEMCERALEAKRAELPATREWTRGEIAVYDALANLRRMAAEIERE